jgi:hypothetical protein
LYAHSTNLPTRVTEEEWTEMWDGFQTLWNHNEHGVSWKVLCPPIHI